MNFDVSTDRYFDTLIIHCSATPPDMDIGADEIRRWHTDKTPKGRGWSDIGYHAVIRLDGTIEAGRPLDRIGAHCAGRNTGSVGICLIGGVTKQGVASNTFSIEQFDALGELIDAFETEHGELEIIGHRDTGAPKACPSFNVYDWLVMTGRRGGGQ